MEAFNTYRVKKKKKKGRRRPQIAVEFDGAILKVLIFDDFHLVPLGNVHRIEIDRVES